MFSKKRHPIICLLEIPVEFIAYVILLGIGAQLDQWMFDARSAEAQGHGFPFFFVLFLLVGAALLLLAVILSIANFVRYSHQKRLKKERVQRAQESSENQEK